MKKKLCDLISLYQCGKLKTGQSTQRSFIYNDIKILTDDGEVTKAGDVIRSILNDNIQLPALYFWSVQDDEAGIHYEDDEYNIHDGKQRFLSLYYFIDASAGTNVVTRINGDEKTFRQLSNRDQNKLLNYEFDIVVRRGTQHEEEVSFYKINKSGEPLTTYEALKGAYNGTFIYEFENYINRIAATYDSINLVNRGDQAIHILHMCLNTINDDKKQEKLTQDRLESRRNDPFNENEFKLSVKLSIINELYKMGLQSSSDFIKLCKITDYIVLMYNKKKSIDKILDYYRKGLSTSNDISKWKIDVHKTAIDSLINSNIKCCYTRFFTNEVKSELYRKSHKCANCGKQLDYNKLEVDHIIPWSNGGRTHITNAQLLCKTCNTSKGANV